MIFESFASLALSRGFHGFSATTPGWQAAISIPLAFSIFVLTGFRYLFRLPVELPANWVFRVNEPGNRRIFLAAVERFLLCWAVAPVALITLPVEMGMLGAGMGFAVAILCLLPSLALMEVLLIRFDKIPFTSAYLAGAPAGDRNAGDLWSQRDALCDRAERAGELLSANSQGRR